MGGRLIVFEGVEGCGKTTQIQYFRAWLHQNYPHLPVVVTREPGGTEMGKHLRSLLLSNSAFQIADRSELLLYAADRAQHVEQVLQPALAQGALILCDRYVDSTIAYQGYGRGLDRQLIEQLNAIATNGLVSDLTFWLDVDVEVGLSRAKKRGEATDRIEQETLAFHRRVRQGFAELADSHPQRMIRIDASLPPAAVSAEIQAVLTLKLAAWGQQ
ncbi:MAG: dTMP kinase [Nostocaceae cyanobacterium]|nr:dTMP kinase [Nostocaceae cyanobacterium]